MSDPRLHGNLAFVLDTLRREYSCATSVGCARIFQIYVERE